MSDWVADFLSSDDDAEAFAAYLGFVADIDTCIRTPKTVKRLTDLLCTAFWDVYASADAWSRFYATLARAMTMAELKLSTLAAFCRLHAFLLDNSDLADGGRTRGRRRPNEG